MQTQTKTLSDFRPFQAWRYDASKLDMRKVIAPPYDVISPSEQEALYERSPYNCIRLILNRIEETDTAENNRYTRAKVFFEKLQKEKVLIQDAPAYYFYKQTFTSALDGKPKTRTALLGRLKLEPFEKGIVIPHEKTLSKPRADRRKLLEATKTNFSPVFGLYEDPQGDIRALHQEIMKTSCLFDVPDDQNVTHALWAVTDPKLTERIHSLMTTKKIYIADGHHRYQTALEYGQEMRRASGEKSAESEMPYDFVLMALVAFQDPGIVLLPTHRILLPFEGFETAAAFAALKPYFKIEEMPLDKLKDALSTASAATSFGLLLEGGKSFFLTLQNLEGAKKLMLQGKPEVWYRLDVNVLSHFIFAKLWNLPDTQWENVLRFTRFDDEAAESVNSGKAKAAFLLKAPPVTVLREMGEFMELMPQKSTYFDPKLASGLVFYSHQA